MPLHARELHLSPRPNCGDTEQPGTRLETSPPAPAPHLGPARSVWPPALWQMAAGWPPDPLPGHTDVGEPSGEAASRKTGRKPSPPHSHRDVVTGSRKKKHTHTVSSVLRAHRPWEAVGPRAWVPRPARPLTSGATHPPRASVPSPGRREGGRPPREAVSGPREKAKGKEPPPSKVEENLGFRARVCKLEALRPDLPTRISGLAELFFFFEIGICCQHEKFESFPTKCRSFRFLKISPF